MKGEMSIRDGMLEGKTIAMVEYEYGTEFTIHFTDGVKVRIWADEEYDDEFSYPRLKVEMEQEGAGRNNAQRGDQL